jgi:hypothetical protein
MEDLHRIHSPTGRLNGFGLNGLAASLQSVFTEPFASSAALANRCAVFSTYDFLRVHCRCRDDQLWRFTSPTAFWDKPVWILPIHRSQEEHWVVAAVHIRQQKIFFFDSLAQRTGWRGDLQVCCLIPRKIMPKCLQDIMVLINRLTLLANRHNHPLQISTQQDAWVAQPLFQLVGSCFCPNSPSHRTHLRASHLRPMAMTAGYGFYAQLRLFSGDSTVLRFLKVRCAWYEPHL